MTDFISNAKGTAVLLASAVTLLLATNAHADIEVIKIGEPSFTLSEIAFGYVRGDRALVDADTFNSVSKAWQSESFGSHHVWTDDPSRSTLLPGTPYDGPYEQEVRRAFAANGLVQTDVLTASEMRSPHFIARGYSFLPDGNTIGNSPDGTDVTVIPGDIYPMQTSVAIWFNEEAWRPDVIKGESPMALSQEGVVTDEHGNVRDFTGLDWNRHVRVGAGGWGPGVSNSELVGEWEERRTILESNEENGWEIVYRWEVVDRRSRVPGDLNHNGELDMHDLDILTQNVAVDASNLRLDLNDDDAVSVDDVDFWVTDLKNTWLGDANLDGEFNSGDFVNVFSAGKYETDEFAHWSEGDWNADERFDSGDFVAAFQGGGYEMGAKAEVANVPEPSSLMLLAFSLIACHFRANGAAKR